MTKGTVLVADDDAAVRLVVNQALVRADFDVRITSNFATLMQWIENGEGDCVVSDVIMPDGEAFDFLPRIKETRPEIPIILISAQNTFMTALKAQEGDVFEYLPKPFDLDRLCNSVERSLFENRGGLSPAAVETYANEMPIIGRSEPMQAVFQAVARMRLSNLPIMLLGESGTGKSLVARVLHDFSDRAKGPFEKITFSGMSAHEIDKLMFGGTKDAGFFERLIGGTLYLNEVLDMPTQTQARLLQWLDQNDDRGSNANIRIIASSSDDLETAVRTGKFREDLYYRLAVVPLALPPLRERHEDVPDLARHFLKVAAIEGSIINHIEPDGMAVLKRHLWPGNVRELENLIHRLCLLHAKESLSRADIEGQLQVRAFVEGAASEEPMSGFLSLKEATQYFADRYFDMHGSADPDGRVYQTFLAEFEEPLIVAALRATNGNQIKAADILGLNRNTLRKKINAYNIRIVKTVGH